MMFQYIAIEGNIGSGKTTLCEKLAKDLDAKLLLESFDDNPFLPDFYKNKDRFALHVELTFLAERFKQIQANINAIDLFSENIISDYLFQKSFVFAQITLKNEELTLFKRLYEIISGILPKPQLLVYLYNNVENLLQNIEKRGRPYEKLIAPEYLEAIHQGYFAFFKQLENQRVLILDISNIDFVKSKTDYLKIKNLLNNNYPIGITRIIL